MYVCVRARECVCVCVRACMCSTLRRCDVGHHNVWLGRSWYLPHPPHTHTRAHTHTPSLRIGVDDAAKQIRDASDKASEYTDNAGNQMNAFVYSALTIFLIIGLVNVILAGLVATRPGTRQNCFRVLACISSSMICLMWVLLLICAITLLVLRSTAGFCDAPFEIINSYVGDSGNSTDAGMCITWC